MVLIELQFEFLQLVLNILLQDKNTGKNIIWATDDYKKFGIDYSSNSEMTAYDINALDVSVLQPRVSKSKKAQKGRTKEKAEVFTPAWVCEKMNSHCDIDWFNIKKKNNEGKIKFIFDSKKSLKSYIDIRKLEVTCGEAPYVVSRYDTTTGDIIEVKNRIGFLDRKLLAISQYIGEKEEWLDMVYRAYESSYGYEYQGDNLLKARINLFYTFIEYYENKWNRFPMNNELKRIATIISRNFWQMDGLTYTVPLTDIKCKIYNWRSKKSFNFIGEDSMKFDYVIGNPPYQDGRKQIYVYFFEQGKKIGNFVDMIFPTGWQEPKTANCLSVLNTKEVKEDRQIIYIENKEDVFAGIEGAKYTNIVLWKRGYDNCLNGKQLLITSEGEKKIVELKTEYDDLSKPSIILSVVDKVKQLNEKTIETCVSTRKPYGFEADPLDKPEKYGIELYDEENEDMVRLFGRMAGSGRTFKYIKREQLPKISPMLDTYKLFLVKAWGNMDEKKGFLGGSYSPIVVARPKDCCTEMYIEVGPFNTLQEAENAQKYFYTKFFRAVFYKKKMSQNTARETYSDVPVQDFTENSDIDWSKSVKEIDEQLYVKYGIEREEINFIEEKIKEIE